MQNKGHNVLQQNVTNLNIQSIEPIDYRLVAYYNVLKSKAYTSYFKRFVVIDFSCNYFLFFTFLYNYAMYVCIQIGMS